MESSLFGEVVASFPLLMTFQFPRPPKVGVGVALLVKTARTLSRPARKIARGYGIRVRSKSSAAQRTSLETGFRRSYRHCSWLDGRRRQVPRGSGGIGIISILTPADAGYCYELVMATGSNGPCSTLFQRRLKANPFFGAQS